jgi:hypothetical protein
LHTLPWVFALLKTHSVVDCIIDEVAHRDLRDEHFDLYRVGVALTWIRTAADSIEELNTNGWETDEKAVWYHFYAGLSAPRTVADSLAVWLSKLLSIPISHPNDIDLVKPAFRKRVLEIAPSLAEYFDSMIPIIKELDSLRQGAQHRAQTPVVFAGDDFNAARWYFSPADRTVLQSDAGRDQYDIAKRLGRWALQLEDDVCLIVRALGDRMGSPKRRRSAAVYRDDAKPEA